jgi:hypothetical protein
MAAIEVVQVPSVLAVPGRLVQHLEARHDAALVAAPGSGTTTLARQVEKELLAKGIRTCFLDLRAVDGLSDCLRRLETDFNAGNAAEHRVAVVDHAADLLPEEFDHWLRKAAEAAKGRARNYLWIGPLDTRAVHERWGLRLHSVPKAHVSFPHFRRDELLSVYRCIARANDCHWGEAILFLLLDWCGNDLALVTGAAEYLHGDWIDNLYDDSIWDRIDGWLRSDPAVAAYRRRLNGLMDRHKLVLQLLRVGAKPLCQRQEVYELTDEALRSLYLQGLVVHNLLPGFYQLRNLLVRYLLLEEVPPRRNGAPRQLFRRFTNERMGQFLQDAESMLRAVLQAAFHDLGPGEVQRLLEAEQAERQLLSPDLNKALFAWAEAQQGGKALRESLAALLADWRKEFRTANTVWAKINAMMASDCVAGDAEPAAAHLRCVEYLTFAELSTVFLHVLKRRLAGAQGKEFNAAQIAERWREHLAKIQRMRNRVAHLRNIPFQDMEDITRTLVSMRNDLLRLGIPADGGGSRLDVADGAAVDTGRPLGG